MHGGSLSEVSLFDVLADTTQERSEGVSHEAINVADFNEIPAPVDAPEPEPEEDEEPYDATVEATKLVNLLNVGNMVVLMPLAGVKMQKSRAGGKKGLERMKIAYQKSADGKKLTPTDEKLVQQFELYKQDLALLHGEIPFSKAEHDALLLAATSYCESSKIRVNATAAFWGVLAGYETSRIIKILTV